MSILNDIVDIDEIGEDITAEICEEIDSNNPHLRDPSLAASSIALKPEAASSRYEDLCRSIDSNHLGIRICLLR